MAKVLIYSKQPDAFRDQLFIIVFALAEGYSFNNLQSSFKPGPRQAWNQTIPVDKGNVTERRDRRTYREIMPKESSKPMKTGLEKENYPGLNYSDKSSSSGNMSIGIFLQGFRPESSSNEFASSQSKKSLHSSEVVTPNLNISSSYKYKKNIYHFDHHRSKRASTDKNKVQSILNYLNNGEKQLESSEGAEIILILGNSGVGKSTLLQFIAGNNSNLISEQICDQDGCSMYYQIKVKPGMGTKNPIGNSFTESFTSIPERISDANTSTIYYDCPGFSDTRDAEHDIGGTYFIQKVAENAKAIKFVFLTTFSAVTNDDKTSFIDMVKHAINMVENVGQYVNSTVLIVTKIKEHTATDEKIIETIATGLRKTIKSILNRKSQSIVDKNEIEFINILLTKVDGNYTKIGFFRAPDKPGPLSDIPSMQDNKKSLLNLIHKNISYTIRDNGGKFKYTVSEASKNYIHDLIEQIDENISSNASYIAKAFESHYKNLVEKHLNKIKFIVDNDKNTVSDSDLLEANLFYTYLNNGYRTITTIIEEINNIMTAEEFVEIINGHIDILNRTLSKNVISDIIVQGRSLKFFQKVQNVTKPINQKALQSPFKDLIIQMNNINKIIPNYIEEKFLIDEFENRIKFNASYIAKAFESYYENLVQKQLNKIKFIVDNDKDTVSDSDLLEANLFFTHLNNGYRNITTIIEEINNITTAEEFAEIINDHIDILNGTLSKNVISDIIVQGRSLKFLQKHQKLTKPINQKALQSPFKDLIIQMINISKIIPNYIEEKFLINEFENRIQSIVKSSGDKIIEYYYHKEEKITDLKNLFTEIDAGHNSLLKNYKIANDMKEISECIKEISRCFYHLNNQDENSISAINNILTAVRYDNNLKFLYALSNKDNQLSINSMNCVHGLDDVIEYLDDSKKWYQFLIRLYDKLSEFKIQRNPNDCSKLSDNIIYNESVKTVSDIMLRQFLAQYYSTNEYEYNEIENIKLSHAKYNALEKVLHSTLKHQTIGSCDTSDKLVIKGHFVKLSDINKFMNHSSCGKPLKFIEIFALKTIFIDIDLDKTGDKLQLTIISPIWDIQGSRRKINLNGKNGQADELSKAVNDDNYSTKTIHSKNGKDGKRGLPGSPGGIFFGIGEEFLNIDNLIVSVDGGNGAPGQHGGDGIDGEKEKDPVVNIDDLVSIDESTIYSSKDCTVEYTISNNQNVKIDRCNGELFGLSFSIKVLWRFATASREGWWWFRPRTGEDYLHTGGNGGNGGKGGMGGNPGIFHIIKLPNDSNFDSNPHQGTKGLDGVDGKGGVGGKGVKHGNIFKVYYEKSNYFPNHFWMSETSYIQNDEWYPSGRNGYTASSNTVSDELTEQKLTLIKPFKTIMNYENYLRENLRGSIHQSYLNNFLTLLANGSSKSIDEFYDTSGFINKLNDLENQFNESPEKNIFLPSYELLLESVDRYIIKNKKIQDYINNKKALDYVKTAILSKIQSIKNNQETYLVIDADRYLTSVETHIQQYKKSLNEVKITDYNNHYQNTTKSLMHEANNFIEHDVIPEINNILEETDNKVDLLLKEVVKLKDAAQTEKENLEKAKKKLQGQLFARKLLGIVQVLSCFAVFAGPHGAAAGAAIGTAATFAENLFFDSSNSLEQAKSTPLPDVVKNSIKKVIDGFKDKQNAFKENLVDAEKQLLEHSSQNLTMLQYEISKAKQDLEKEIAGDRKSQDSIKNIREKLQKFIEKEENSIKDNMKKNGEKSDIKSQKKLNILKHVGKIVNIVDTASNVFHKNKNFSNNIDQLGLQIEIADEKIKNLEVYEESIYQIILPMAHSMNGLAEKISNNLTDQSHVAIDIISWKIQSKIRDVKFQIEEMTAGFEVQKNIKQCLDKFQYGIEALIKVFDRIQEAKDRQKLADYIADINSDVKISNDNQLNHEIKNLELLIKSNLVLQEYNQVLNSFKQYVFPFAEKYLKKFSVDNQKNDINTSIDSAVNKIQKIKDEIVKKNSIIDPEVDNNYYPKAIFNSYENSDEKPFFIWKHDLYQNEILELLQGNEIVINADIKKGINLNAVKFNNIGVNIKLLNTSLQQEFDTELKSFVIEMTHLGDSQYKCGNKYYTITHYRQKIIHSAMPNDDGIYGNPNSVYHKITLNRSILSPYTMWKIKLDIKHSEELTDESFNRLIKYSNQPINLELVGGGNYVHPHASECVNNNNLEKYYKVLNV